MICHEEEVMGTVVSYSVTPGDISAHELALAMAESNAELHRLDDLFSTWQAESPMSRFRRGELDPTEVPGEIPTVLGLCAALKRVSEGWFDPWAIAGGVDPTGLVKGWAIDRATAVLADAGVRRALVNGGGDIATHGTADDEDGGWRVGIRHPWHPDGLACIIELVAGSAVATSARYERGEHLVDPFAGRASRRQTGRRVASATVVGESLAVADGLATALAVGGDALPGDEPLQPGYEAYRIYEDGNEESTPRFPFWTVKAEPSLSAR